ncbi:MAG: zinc-binding dehydrogenase [Thomasclavelia sp.]
MKAVVLNKSCKANQMEIKEVEIPKIKDNWVLVKVKGFGLNHSEILLRQFEIDNDYIKKPIIPGIECVGIIVDPANSHFKKGDKVIALMGGMGRSFNGSYCQYALLPVKNVFKIESNLSWEKLAAIPETFFTAYGSLFESMAIKENERVLNRGASSALGMAAIMLAKAKKCYVIASLRNKQKIELLSRLGADLVIEDTRVKELDFKVDKVSELIGCKTLKESMGLVKKHGIVCHTGILGGQYAFNHFDPIKDIPNGVYLSSFYSNFPTQQLIDEMFAFINENKIEPVIGKVYDFNQIGEAHQNMEEHKVVGKSVVLIKD